MMITMERDRLPEAPSCLVIGPIGDEHAPIDTEPRTRYEEALQVLSKIIEPACVRYGITPVRADRMHRPGEVPEQVLVAIRDYDLVIADLSKANPNVLYELALRHAVGKCVIPISGWGSLPFDVGWIRTIPFVRSEIGYIDGRKRLEEALGAALKDGCDRVTATRILQETASSRGATVESDTAQNEAVISDEPGFLDLLAEMEEAVPRVTGILEEMTGLLGQVAALAVKGTEDIKASDASGGQVAGRRLAILGRFASKLSKLAGQSEDLVGRYRDDISKVDKGVSYLLDRLELEPQLISEAGQFPETLVRLADITKESLAATDSLVQQTAQLATIAAVMRTPATRIANSWRALATLSTPIFDWGSRASKVQGNRGPTAIGSP